MSVQDVYFATLGRVCSAIERSFSDRHTAQAFGRLGRTLSLIRLHRYGEGGITIDPAGTGFPLLSEVLSVTADIRERGDGGGNPSAIRAEMLDYMLSRRRRPDVRMVSRMAEAVYLRRLRDHGDAFESEPAEVTIRGRGGQLECGWDYWDGAGGAPVVAKCRFAAASTRIDDVSDIERRLCNAARLFSGVGFKPVSLANEIDEEIEEIRLKELTKLSIGPFRSDLFTSSGDAVDLVLRGLGRDEHSWAIGWTVDRISSAGTAHRSVGLFRRKRPYEMFAIDTAEIEKAERGCTDFERHLLLPAEVYRMLADRSDAQAILQNRRVHVLGEADDLTEDV